MDLDIISSFEWKVAVGGYHWIETTLGAGLTQKPHQPGPPRTYKPLSKDHAGLFRTFAQIPQTRGGVLDFANEFGLLGQPLTQTTTGGQPLGLEARFGAFAMRHDSIRRSVAPLASVEFFDQSPDPDSRWCWTAQIAAMAETLNFQDAGFQALGDSELLDDTKNTIIQIRLDQALRDTAGVRTQWTPNHRRLLGLRWGPTSLLGAMWLQLAMWLSESTTLRACSVCKGVMEISRNPTFGARSHAVFCSTRCRSQDYRDRQKRARQLAKKRWTAARIAKKVRSDTSTVKGWLRAKK